MRWKRREEKQRAKKAMPKHGKGMMQMYVNALRKRLKGDR